MESKSLQEIIETVRGQAMKSAKMWVFFHLAITPLFYMAMSLSTNSLYTGRFVLFAFAVLIAVAIRYIVGCADLAERNFVSGIMIGTGLFYALFLAITGFVFDSMIFHFSGIQKQIVHLTPWTMAFASVLFGILNKEEKQDGAK